MCVGHPVDLVAVVDAGPGVEAVQAGQGAVPCREAEDEAPGAAVQQRHGAHVARLPAQQDVQTRAEVTCCRG